MTATATSGHANITAAAALGHAIITAVGHACLIAATTRTADVSGHADIKATSACLRAEAASGNTNIQDAAASGHANFTAAASGHTNIQAAAASGHANIKAAATSSHANMASRISSGLLQSCHHQDNRPCSFTT